MTIIRSNSCPARLNYSDSLKKKLIRFVDDKKLNSTQSIKTSTKKEIDNIDEYLIQRENKSRLTLQKISNVNDYERVRNRFIDISIKNQPSSDKRTNKKFSKKIMYHFDKLVAEAHNNDLLFGTMKEYKYLYKHAVNLAKTDMIFKNVINSNIYKKVEYDIKNMHGQSFTDVLSNFHVLLKNKIHSDKLNSSNITLQILNELHHKAALLKE